MTVMKNGDVIVKDGANNVITGDAALKAIKEAQAFGVDLTTGDRAGQRRAKTVAANVSSDAFGKINIMRSNIINLQEAKRLVTEGGANTGFIMDKLPNLFAGSIALNQIQNVLGLNIIGSVTFSVLLSEGELNLALNTALPTNFNEPDLIDWIDRKIIAEQKLSEYIQEQAIFLADGDKTIGDWLRFQQKEEESKEIPEVKLDFSTMTTEDILKINPDELSESDQESLDKRMNELGM